MPDHVDVLIVGAGCRASGRVPPPGAASRPHVRDPRGARRDRWDLGPVPLPGCPLGLRRPQFAYAFKPWTGDKAIVDGASIRATSRRPPASTASTGTSASAGGSCGASWSSEAALWTVDVEGGSQMTARWFFCATGYYRYDGGYAPPMPGIEDFEGRVVHPQHWPEDLDHAGRRVVVVGSGATAVTIVPAMAETAAHVTMLQRSPSYILPQPSHDPLAAWLSGRLSAKRAYRIVRRKNIAQQAAVY